MLSLPAQIDAPTPGNELYWLLGLMATAIGVLFWKLLASKDSQTEDWKDTAKTATAGWSTSVDSLRALSDAVDRQGRDTAGTLHTVSADIKKLHETMGIVDRRLERLEGHRAPPGGAP